MNETHTASEELELLRSCLEEHKAEDVLSIDISASSPFASYALLATAPNPRALAAFQDHVEEALLSHGYDVSVKEGEPDSGWLIIQGEEVLVHLLLLGHRRMLDLEGLLSQLNAKYEKAAGKRGHKE